MGKNCCKCVKSKCLKLYCSCFAKNLMCEGCDCRNCQNNEQFKEERMRCVENLKKRNPNAFKPKVIKSEKDDQVMYLAKGCSCKLTNCAKKYCPCVNAGVNCTESCYCRDCKNICKIEIAPITPLENLNMIEVNKMEIEQITPLENLNMIEVNEIEKEEEGQILMPMEDLNNFKLDEKREEDKRISMLELERVDRELEEIIKKLEEEDKQKEAFALISTGNLEVVRHNPLEEVENPNADPFVHSFFEQFKDKTFMQNTVRAMLETAKTIESMNATYELIEHQVISQLGSYLNMLREFEHNWKTVKTREIEYYMPNQ